MNDAAKDIDLRRRRLAFRAHHRGIKEMDLILGRYVDDHLQTLDGERLSMLEALIEVPDRDLYYWISGREPVPAEYDNAVMAELKALGFSAADYGGGGA